MQNAVGGTGSTVKTDTGKSKDRNQIRNHCFRPKRKLDMNGLSKQAVKKKREKSHCISAEPMAGGRRSSVEY